MSLENATDDQIKAEITRRKSEITNGCSPACNDALKALMVSFPTMEDLKPPKECTYLIKGILESSGTAAIYGAPAGGKTFLAMDMAYHIATGKNWFGRRTKKTGVIYFALEGHAGIKKRLYALMKENGEFQIGLSQAPADLRDTDYVQKVVDMITQYEQLHGKVGMIIIDTLARAMAGSEESNADMSAMMEHTTNIANGLNLQVMMIHHVGKDETRGMRGGSALIAALDSSLFVKQDEETQVITVSCTKSKDNDRFLPFDYRLKVVDLGTDEELETMTSCVVEPVDSLAESLEDFAGFTGRDGE